MTFSTDSDFSALTDANCIRVRSMKVDTKQLSAKTRSSVNVNEVNIFVYEIVGSSNVHMNDIKEK